MWSQSIIDKIIEKHRVFPDEVDEAIFEDTPIYHICSKPRYAAYGKTKAGRYLFIILDRINKTAEFRLITARDMESNERKYYHKHT